MDFSRWREHIPPISTTRNALYVVGATAVAVGVAAQFGGWALLILAGLMAIAVGGNLKD